MEVLPSQLRLAPPPTIPQARSYLFKQKSDLQEFDVAKGTRIRVNIPRLQRTYLTKDSYIRFKLNIGIPTCSSVTPRAPAVFLDRAGAYNLFERIEVYDYLGSTLLEQTQNIPVLWTLLQDIDANMMTTNGKTEAIQGMQGAYSSDDLPNSDIISSVIVRAHVGGKQVTNSGSTTTTSFSSHEFCLPVLSFLGNLSDKFVPLHNGFSIDFILSSVAQAFVSRTEPGTTNNNSVTPKECWISNFEYCCQVIELGDQAESLVMSSNGNDPWTIHTRQFRYFADNLSASSSTFGVDLNLNVVSLRNIRFNMRPEGYQNNILYPGNSHRIRNFLESFNFQYGSSYLPELAGIQCRGVNLPLPRNTYTVNATNWAPYHFTQAYTELLKTGQPELFSDNRLECPIRFDEYAIDTAYDPLTATGDAGITAGVPTALDLDTRCGKFASGIDLRLSTKDVISGIDTNGLLVRLNGKFDYNNVQNVIAAIIDIWAEYDAFIQIIPGMAVTTTF